MSDFLSDDWMTGLDQQLRAAPPAPHAPMTVQYIVTRGVDAGPDIATDTTDYVLELGPNPSARFGLAEDADITFRLDDDTAAKISRGELSSEEAFLTGLLDLEGDTGLLIEAYRASGDA